MDLRLKGKRVLVSGGTTGIGRAAALAFGAEGAEVAVFAERPAEKDDPVAVIARVPAFRREAKRSLMCKNILMAA